MITGAKENGLPDNYIENVLMKIEDNGYNGSVEVQLDLLKKA